MEDTQAWVQDVRESASNIANIRKQRDAIASNFEKFFPPPLELYVTLVDDFRLDEFLEEVVRPVDQSTYDVGMRLSLMLDAFPEEKFDDLSITENHEWLTIAGLAGTFAEMLRTLLPAVANKTP